MACCYDLFQTFSVFVIGIQLVFGVFRWIYGNIIGPHFLESKNLREYGNWALITGATDGIGKQYARLVRTSLGRAWIVAKEISESFNVQTKVIAVNFTSGPEIYDQIKQQIAGIEIGILVNNVGMFYPAPELFLDIPDRDKFIEDIIRCNITSVPMMCSLVLPQMVQRKRGLIVSVSSMASLVPGPVMTIYSASKAFVTKFSNDLAAEYESQGVDIQVLVTGGVGTNMSKIEGGGIGIPTARQYVESAVRYVGYTRQTTGFFSHSVIVIIVQLMTFIWPKLGEYAIRKEMHSHDMLSTMTTTTMGSHYLAKRLLQPASTIAEVKHFHFASYSR